MRQEQFAKIKQAFTAQVTPKIKAGGYSKFATAEMNNATLGLFRTYMEDLSDFEKLYVKCGENMDEFIAKVKTLEKSDDPVAGLKALITP